MAQVLFNQSILKSYIGLDYLGNELQSGFQLSLQSIYLYISHSLALFRSKAFTND